MNLLRVDPRWTGFLRDTPLLLLAIFLTTIVVFSFSCVLADELINASNSLIPLRTWEDVALYKPKPSIIIVYQLAAPILSIIYILSEFLLHIISRAIPVVTILFSTLFTVGWIVQFSAWFSCDFGLWQTSEYTCTLWPALGREEGGVSQIQMARFIFTGLLVLGYMALVGFAAVALYRGSVENGGKEKVGRSRSKDKGQSLGWES